GQREGWSEILLSDGRRAWVPTADITHDPDVPRATEMPSMEAASPPAAAVDANTRELAAEVARLRRVVDDLATWRTKLPDAAPSAVPLPEGIPWAIGGAGLVAGI